MGAPAENRATDRDRIPALAGRLSAVSLFDLCQFLMLNRKTGTLTVRSGPGLAAGSTAGGVSGASSGSGSGTVYLIFLDGQLLSAVDDSHRDGEDVVLRAVQWTEGTFEFTPGPVPPDRHIQASTENILLEAARRIDEMHAEEGEAGGEAQKVELAFLEKQERSNALADAFRSVVAEDEKTRSGAGWKGTILRSLARPSCDRLLLGPGPIAGLVVNGRYEEIGGVPPQEIRAWMDELSPQPSGRGRRGLCLPRATRQEDGSTLWAVRVGSPGGDWLAVSLARPDFPNWSELGLPEEDFTALERMRSGLVVVLGESPQNDAGSPVRLGLAAWLLRRAGRSAICGAVIEDLPRFDWSALPGRWSSIPAAWARPEGRLDALLNASGARTLVWIGGCEGRILAQALQLAAAGFLVVLAEEAGDLEEWLDRAEQRLALEKLVWRPSDEALGIAWQLRGGASPSGMPLQSRIVRLGRAGRSD